MDRLLDLIYKSFIEQFQELELGHMFEDKRLCELWEMIQAYDLLDNNTLGLKERKQILEFYDDYS